MLIMATQFKVSQDWWVVGMKGQAEFGQWVFVEGSGSKWDPWSMDLAVSWYLHASCTPLVSAIESCMVCSDPLFLFWSGLSFLFRVDSSLFWVCLQSSAIRTGGCHNLWSLKLLTFEIKGHLLLPFICLPYFLSCIYYM